ncbi:HNH endonuclease family protein [Pedobacter agri]|uniref:hypothetical protein n=1 Tax=Pedobacter agri TaxID=454586 RepID=UPI002931F6F3|nr:hypothetical protein [Pedobacter agri]
MIFIDITKYKPSKEWLVKAQAVKDLVKAETDYRKKLEIIEKHKALWGELKEDLRSLSNNKCWYSESVDASAHSHVDHFRPKGKVVEKNKTEREGYWWLAFDYLNYRYSGGAGNVRKKDKFDVIKNKCTKEEDDLEDEVIYLLDPCKRADVGLLNFIENGEITYSAELADWNKERVIYTIETLNLNFNMLIEERAKVWKKCNSLITDAQSILEELSTKQTVKNNTLFEEKLEQIAELKDKTKPFSAVAQSCIYSSGLSWLKQI